MRRILCTVEYDGTAYAGWQRQLNGLAVQQVLEEAAQLAAYHSKARDSAQVPVDYCAVRYVKKPAGAKPGMVIFTNQHTLYVKPEQR